MTKPRKKRTDNLVQMPTEASAITRVESSEIGREEVARRAYELFLERGCEHGRDLEDWLRAERELRDEAALAVA